MPGLYEYEPNDYEFADRRADKNDDQLPLFSTVGRGIKGDSSRIVIADPDTESETHLVGGYIDHATGIFHTDWVSENINGGRLMYQYNLRSYTIPRTFTITFKYQRPGRSEWSWTTPAIPYIWSVDNENGSVSENPDHIIGSGVATLFIKTMHDEEWNEKLIYPEGFTRDDFNAPDPLEAWSANIIFGHGGDIDIPDFDDIAKIIGISKEDIYNILEDNSITINGIDANSLIEYIDNCDKRDLDHIHADLGFCESDHDTEGAFGGFDTVKDYIDDKVIQLTTIINNMKSSIGDLIYGAEIDEDGNISLPEGTMIPTGNINVFSGSTANYLRTRNGEVNNDIKAV